MNWNNFYSLIKNRHPVLTVEDIKIVANNKVTGIQLSRWVKKRLLAKLRRGVYVLPENTNINPFVLANKIFEPSYVSLESALFYYGLIPDVVIANTSVTSRKTCQFEANSQNFIYQKIKSELFFGYEEVKTNNWGFLIASSEKAILDYFYLHQNELKNEDDWQELRINKDIYLKEISKNKLFKFCNLFNNQRLNKTIKEFDKYIRTN